MAKKQSYTNANYAELKHSLYRFVMLKLQKHPY